MLKRLIIVSDNFDKNEKQCMNINKYKLIIKRKYIVTDKIKL